MPPAAAIGGGLALGALAGSMSDTTTQRYQSGLVLAPESDWEKSLDGSVASNYNSLSSLVDSNTGNAQDSENGLQSQRDLAAMLKQYSQGGAIPNQTDINQSNELASALFGGQRTLMNQGFADQRTQANKSAALLGRSVDDPILQAKLAQEQTRQSSVLDANQGAYAAQYANQLPGQRLGYAQQNASVLQGIASQAMSNRQALLSLGSQLQSGERNFRLSTAERYSNGETESGGGLKGAIQGGLAGAGTGAGLASGFGGSGFSNYGQSSQAAMAPSPFSGYSYPQQSSNIFGVNSFSGGR